MSQQQQSNNAERPGESEEKTAPQPPPVAVSSWVSLFSGSMSGGQHQQRETDEDNSDSTGLDDFSISSTDGGAPPGLGTDEKTADESLLTPADSLTKREARKKEGGVNSRAGTAVFTRIDGTIASLTTAVNLKEDYASSLAKQNKDNNEKAKVFANDDFERAAADRKCIEILHQDKKPGTVDGMGVAVAVALVVEGAPCWPAAANDSSSSAGRNPNNLKNNNSTIPRAVQYSPSDNANKKKHMKKRGRYTLCIYLAILSVTIVLAVGIAAGIVFGKNKDDNSNGSSSANSGESFAAIKAQIRKAVGSEKLIDPESPYSRALKWIAFEDPMQLSAEDSNLIQRYIAAYFYYATTFDGPWRTCNPPVDPSTTFCTNKALVDDVSVDYGAYKYVPSNAWLSDSSECTWAGLACDDGGQIQSIDLPGASLSGPSFPEGITNWPFLQSIIFTANKLHGPLPVELSALSHLVTIHLGYNSFTGTIPTTWWQMIPSLQNVEIAWNGITGSIPEEVWQAQNLKSLQFGSNELTGTISSEIGRLHDLKFVNIQDNKLTGSLPTEIGLLKSMVDFDLSLNKLEGEIPWESLNWWYAEYISLGHNQLQGSLTDAVRNLFSLSWLDLAGNPLLSGAIPEELYVLPNLAEIGLDDCSFSGTLSPFIEYLGETLYSFRISNNQFSGTIPKNFTMLNNLETAWLQGNHFTGTVPEIIPRFNGQAFIPEDFRADCLPNEGGNVDLSCSMCTACCKNGGSFCVPT